MKELSHQTIFQEYVTDSGRGTGREKVVCILLTTPEEILSKTNNFVITQLSAADVSNSIGLYFYRFKNVTDHFIKIGECTRQDGIKVRFQRGWHRTERYSDTYLSKKKKNGYVDSEFLNEIRKISPSNPAYFVFYEHQTTGSHPKIDEVYAYRMHKRLFKRGTASPERMNGNPLLARSLVWHKGAFSEVVRGQLPDGTAYPICTDGYA
ncbi:hypothetical protein JFU47_06420 [Pseudomonas sp. TH39(2020)]|uniref:hypothetical protein n=1 Tax=Pseudomonas sp. TH39(2020) TaxID=2796349 RepID=UPI00191313CF|nr:hypothetical protein [Pseudomonas sp. TH39(2020)]MBK5396354.1 hypothetical protein [Pseudomonas sp. TH39(2020)]